MGHIRQKIFGEKLDPNIEPTSQETHFDTVPYASIFQSGLGEIFVVCNVRKPIFECELLESYNG